MNIFEFFCDIVSSDGNDDYSCGRLCDKKA